MPYPWHHPLLHQDATISGSIKATLLGLTLLELRLTHAPAFTPANSTTCWYMRYWWWHSVRFGLDAATYYYCCVSQPYYHCCFSQHFYIARPCGACVSMWIAHDICFPICFPDCFPIVSQIVSQFVSLFGICFPVWNLFPCLEFVSHYSEHIYPDHLVIDTKNISYPSDKRSLE